MASSMKRVALANSARKLPKGAKLVRAADPKQEIEISVRLRAKRADDEAVMALGALPPRERQYLSRPQFAEQMGADPADVAKIDNFAHHHDLNVKSVHLASRTVKLTGTVKALSAAFGVKLNMVKHEGAIYRMRKGSVQIPADLEVSSSAFTDSTIVPSRARTSGASGSDGQRLRARPRTAASRSSRLQSSTTSRTAGPASASASPSSSSTTSIRRGARPAPATRRPICARSSRRRDSRCRISRR